MTVSIFPKDQIFAPHNIRIGLAEIIAEETPEGVRWYLPGLRYTTDRATAERYAERMNQLIQGNLGRVRESLV